MGRVIPLPKRPAAADPWTASKLRRLLGSKLAEAIGVPELAAVAARLQYFRDAAAIEAQDSTLLSDQSIDLILETQKQFRQARVSLRAMLDLIEKDTGERSADYGALLAELERNFPEAPDEEARRKGGRPHSALTRSAPYVARIVRGALKTARTVQTDEGATAYAGVELSEEDFRKTVIEITACWIDDKSPTGAHGNGLTTRELVRRALNKAGFFEPPH
jgi:hypothetical protein